MRARGFHFLLLALVLWGSEAQGRGSTKTWVEAMGTTPSCTLDVVLVTSFLCLEAMAVVFWISHYDDYTCDPEEGPYRR